MASLRPPARLRRASLHALAAFTWAGIAQAQEAGLVLAREGFLREAEAAARRGDHAPAIENAQRAAALRPTPSVAYFLAREFEAIGQNVESLAQATACARGAEADRGLHNREALLRACHAVADRVSARVGQVVVQIAPPLPQGLVLRVGGRSVPAAVLNAPFTVEAGAVEVVVEAEGHAPSRGSVTVAPGGVERVELALSPLPAPPPPRTESPPPRTESPPPRIESPPSLTPWIATGVGLSVLAVGSLVGSYAFFALANEAQAARDLACASPCLASSAGYGVAAEQNARYRENLEFTTGALVTGAALSVAASLWWAFGRRFWTGPRPALAVLPGALRLGVVAAW